MARAKPGHADVRNGTARAGPAIGPATPFIDPRPPFVEAESRPRV